MPATNGKRRSEVGLIALSGGTRYVLNDVCGYALYAIDGLGIADVYRLSQKAIAQLGDTDLGFGQNPRTLMLAWDIARSTSKEYWNARAELLGIFRPRVDDPVILTFTLPYGLRATQVNLVGGLDFGSSTRMDGKSHRIVAILKASDPRLYNPTRKVESFPLIEALEGWEIGDGVAADGWEIGDGVAPDGWPIGASDVNTFFTFTYAGGSTVADLEYPILRLFGPITNPIITNVTTNEVLPFTASGGLILGKGEFIEIDLMPGIKTASRGTGESVEAYLDSNNNLATWHLSYASELLYNGTRSTGDNVIKVYGIDSNTAARLEIIYYERYIGA